jgi:SAM-dependent methyltransferase
MISKKSAIASWKGYCPICQKNTIFSAQNAWFRDYLFCQTCDGGSIPRERALMLAVRSLLPNYSNLRIHESSPAPRGVSTVLAKEAAGYIPTQFFPEIPLGSLYQGIRCENIEIQTFPSNSFDLVVTQDVMEHVFNPKAAYEEIYRTLKPGGYYIHTTPIYKELLKTIQKASITLDGVVSHLSEPEYHGNPISGDGSLVTFHYGYDIAELICGWTSFDVEIRRFSDRTHGIVAEFTEVIVCSKPI